MAGIAGATSGWLLTIARSPYLALLIDLVVLANAIMVGLEVDYGGEGLDAPRLCISCVYALELPLRIVGDGLKSWRRVSFNLLNIAVLALVVVDIAQGQFTWFWRSSLLLVVRYLRVITVAERWPLLADLWVVLVGFARAARALTWLALLLCLVLYASAAAATGLVGVSRVDGAAEACAGLDPRDCFQAYEYFGSIGRSALTLLQLATLDTWASHIVRPLFLTKPFAAAALVVFACATAYGLLSVAMGVLVWSTVELARSHGDHALIKAMREDKEIIQNLGDFFDNTLFVEQRTTLDLTDLQEAMLTPHVARNLRDLDLPVTDLRDLFLHLDKRRMGEISVEELRQGLAQMKNPANRFDIACLSATIGGSVTFTGRVEKRANKVSKALGNLSTTLEFAFAEVEKLHLPGGKMSEAPELLLRTAGRIVNAEPPRTPRYS